MNEKSTDGQIEQTSVATYFGVFISLVMLLLLTVAAGEIDLGWLNLPIALLIATFKASLILAFFMHLYNSSSLVRLIAFAGLYWLAILMGLALCDYLARPAV